VTTEAGARRQDAGWERRSTPTHKTYTHTQHTHTQNTHATHTVKSNWYYRQQEHKEHHHRPNHLLMMVFGSVPKAHRDLSTSGVLTGAEGRRKWEVGHGRQKQQQPKESRKNGGMGEAGRAITNQGRGGYTGTEGGGLEEHGTLLCGIVRHLELGKAPFRREVLGQQPPHE
jgi:hypothetical protein